MNPLGWLFDLIGVGGFLILYVGIIWVIHVVLKPRYLVRKLVGKRWLEYWIE